MKNYFELFQLPKQFNLHLDLLTEHYHALQSELHPDRFVGASESERQAATRYSALVNDAYSTLKSPLARAIHLLALHGVSVDFESSSIDDIDLLEKQMAFREQLESPENLPALEQAILLDIASLEKTLSELFHQQEWEAAKKEVTKLQFYIKLQQEVKK